MLYFTKKGTRKVKIRTKILAGFMVVVLIGVIIGAAGFVTTGMLSSIATELHGLQLEGASISTVLNAHYLWRQNLTEAVLNGAEFTGSLSPDTCALGEWYNSPEAHRMNDPQLLQLLANLEEPHRMIHEEASTVVAYIEAGELEQAQQFLNNTILPTTQEVIEVLTDMQSRYSVLTEAKNAETDSIELTVTVINITMIAIALIAGIFFALLVANMVCRPILPITAFMNKAGLTGDLRLGPEEDAVIKKYSAKKDELGQLARSTASFVDHIVAMSETLETMSHGDLTVDATPISEKDVIGNSLARLLESFNIMFEGIQNSTMQVASGSKQVADCAQSLAQGSTEQSQSVEELSGSISEIAKKTKANAEISGNASALADSIKSDAQKGTRQMSDMMGAGGEINEASRNISKILKTIDDIAFQTNILALNAAVEAARAGQHGKGFAVVADEVRSLAAKSAEASSNSGVIIQNAIAKAELGSKIADETSKSLSEIVSGINESSRMIGEIAKLSAEQSHGISQINNGIEQVARVVQQNSATAEESAAASEEMSAQSTILEQLIAQFTLKKAPAATVAAETGFSLNT